MGESDLYIESLYQQWRQDPGSVPESWRGFFQGFDLARGQPPDVDARTAAAQASVGDLIRASLVQGEWRTGDEVAGAIILVYDHHKRDIVKTLTDVQHDCHGAIISTQHVHLDHDNCLEIIAVRGKAGEIDSIVKRLKTVKGLKHVSLSAGSTGRRLP